MPRKQSTAKTARLLARSRATVSGHRMPIGTACEESIMIQPSLATMATQRVLVMIPAKHGRRLPAWREISGYGFSMSSRISKV